MMKDKKEATDLNMDLLKEFLGDKRQDEKERFYQENQKYKDLIIQKQEEREHKES